MAQEAVETQQPSAEPPSESSPPIELARPNDAEKLGQQISEGFVSTRNEFPPSVNEEMSDVIAQKVSAIVIEQLSAKICADLRLAMQEEFKSMLTEEGRSVSKGPSDSKVPDPKVAEIVPTTAGANAEYPQYTSERSGLISDQTSEREQSSPGLSVDQWSKLPNGKVGLSSSSDSSPRTEGGGGGEPRSNTCPALPQFSQGSAAYVALTGCSTVKEEKRSASAAGELFAVGVSSCFSGPFDTDRSDPFSSPCSSLSGTTETSFHRSIAALSKDKRLKAISGSSGNLGVPPGRHKNKIPSRTTTLRGVEDSLCKELFQKAALKVKPASEQSGEVGDFPPPESRYARRPSIGQLATQLSQLVPLDTSSPPMSPKASKKKKGKYWSTVGSMTSAEASAACSSLNNLNPEVYGQQRVDARSAPPKEGNKYEFNALVAETQEDPEKNPPKFTSETAGKTEHRLLAARDSLTLSATSTLHDVRPLESLRERREEELTRHVSCGSSGPGDEMTSEQNEKTPFAMSFVSVVLRILGVLPWDEYKKLNLLYPWLVILVTVLALVSCLQAVIQSKQAPDEQLDETNPLCDMAFALGACVLLLYSRIMHREIEECNTLLLSYASNFHFLQIWGHQSMRDALVTAAVWLIVVLERCRALLMRKDAGTRNIDMQAILHLTSFLFASAVLLVWMNYIQYLARCILSMIDTFVFRFVDHPDFSDAITDWNVLQAVIRKTCRCIQIPFFVLQTTMVAAGLLSILDATSYEAGDLLVFLPNALIMVAVARVFLCGGAVTDKCARVPSVVNSLNIGTVLDRDRSYLVEYITHSQAGFYIFEVKVTSAVVMKLFYFSCIVAVTLATRVVSLD